MFFQLQWELVGQGLRQERSCSLLPGPKPSWGSHEVVAKDFANFEHQRNTCLRFSSLNKLANALIDKLAHREEGEGLTMRVAWSDQNNAKNVHFFTGRSNYEVRLNAGFWCQLWKVNICLPTVLDHWALGRHWGRTHQIFEIYSLSLFPLVMICFKKILDIIHLWVLLWKCLLVPECLQLHFVDNEPLRGARGPSHQSTN